MTEAMALPPVAFCLSGKSATRSASAFAVRASETDTLNSGPPSHGASREAGSGLAEWVGGKAAAFWTSAKPVVVVEPPLPFPGSSLRRCWALRRQSGYRGCCEDSRPQNF